MATGNSNLHVVFVPWFAPGHIIPLVQLARLFAARGVRSTIVTTVHNALTFRSSIDRDIEAGYPLTVHTLKFPAFEVGLPTGVESLSDCTNADMISRIFRAISLLQTPIEQLVLHLSPDCIFSDMFFAWTVDLADELKIPRLLFYPNNLIYHSISHSLKVYAPQANVKSESESFIVPNLPDKITMKKSQVSHQFLTKTELGDMMDKVRESEKRSYGVVHNTFYEIEPAYAEHIKKIRSTKTWNIVPLFYFLNQHRTGGEKNSVLTWLDEQKPKSVIYVCFGSMVRIPEAQITEIALALEESKQPFIWVVRKATKEGNGGIPDGFEERIGMKNKGLVITGWAPQVEILEHPSLGGFLTHCGWNSVLEAAVAGVPLITWPLYANHFYDEKLVELLGIEVRVGADVWNPSIEISSPIIEKRSIVEAIQLLTGESAIAESIRENSSELAIKAKKVVEEGGSSFNELNGLIDALRAVKIGVKP